MKNVIIVFVFAVLFSTGLYFFVTMVEQADRRNKTAEYNAARDLYGGWMKLHPGVSITFEEWMALKQNYLLPGQVTPEDKIGDAANAFVGGMVGGMVGGGLMRR